MRSAGGTLSIDMEEHGGWRKDGGEDRSILRTFRDEDGGSSHARLIL